MSDDVIHAIRKVRHEISAECGHDVHKVATYCREVGERVRREGKSCLRSSARQNMPKGSETTRK